MSCCHKFRSRYLCKEQICESPRHLRLVRLLRDRLLRFPQRNLKLYPIPTEPWHYMFHTDMEFSSGENFAKAIERLRERGVEVHIYGIYQKGKDL